MKMKAIRPLVLAAASLLVIAAPAFAQEKKAPAAAPAEKPAAKATDPVCGMEVDTKTAPSATYKGKKYYFCSPSEKTEFEKNPEKYLTKKKSS